MSHSTTHPQLLLINLSLQQCLSANLTNSTNSTAIFIAVSSNPEKLPSSHCPFMIRTPVLDLLLATTPAWSESTRQVTCNTLLLLLVCHVVRRPLMLNQTLIALWVALPDSSLAIQAINLCATVLAHATQPSDQQFCPFTVSCPTHDPRHCSGFSIGCA